MGDDVVLMEKTDVAGFDNAAAIRAATKVRVWSVRPKSGGARLDVALDVHNDWCRLRGQNKALRAVADAARALHKYVCWPHGGAPRAESQALADKLAALDAAKVKP